MELIITPVPGPPQGPLLETKPQPRFTGMLKVNQLHPGNAWQIWAGLGLGMLLMMGLMAVFVLYLDSDATGWKAYLGLTGMIALVFLAIVLFFIGMFVPFVLAERFKWTKPEFSATTFVKIDPDALDIKGLGRLPWSEVLSLEGIPDSDTQIKLYTAKHHVLLLSFSEIEKRVLPALSAYLLQGEDTGADTYRVAVFSLWRFRAWIALGYVAGLALLIGILNHENADGIKTLVGILFCVPVSACLVWAIPLAQITTFAASRVRSVTVGNGWLTTEDGRVRLELAAVEGFSKTASGLGYSFEYVRLKPKRGRAFSFIRHEAEAWWNLLDALEANCARFRRPIAGADLRRLD